MDYLTNMTHSQFRLRLYSGTSDSESNWLFLPGGPGLGSDYFISLVSQLSIPANLWLGDFPNDGSNQSSVPINFNDWDKALLDALMLLNNPVLVAHSFAGMFVLSKPVIAKHIAGLILLDTSPTAAWQTQFVENIEKYRLPDLTDMREYYLRQPSNETFKQLTLACAPYFFLEHELQAGLEILKLLDYSHLSYDWAQQYFHPHYQAQWFSNTLPTLIMSGTKDYLTPLSLFSDYTQSNVSRLEIEQAGHFCWLGGGSQVVNAIEAFHQELMSH